MAVSAAKITRILTFGALLAVLLLWLERCTTLNVTSPDFLRPAQLNDAPLLKDLSGSASRAIAHISDPYRSHITYDPKGEYFIVVGREIMKFDRTGRKTFTFANNAASQLPPFSHFIVTPEAVYDLSRTPPLPEPVVQVVNGKKDRNFTLAYWEKSYAEAYAKADTVILASFFPDLRKQPSFMRIDGQWVLFYTSTSNDKMDVDWELGATIEGFPAKMDRTILLKDPVSGRYAANSDGLRDGEVALPEDALTYPPLGQLKTLRFDKTYVSEQVAYTPIPIILAGPAWYRLSIGDEAMTFRETGIRHVFGPFESKLSWFILPEPYSAKTDVSFLEFRPTNNIDTEGSDGLYIIRPR